MSRSRAYVFTVNNYTDEDEHQVWALPHYHGNVKYICVGKEVGESGTHHLQGYVYFNEKKSLKQLKEWFPTAHFEEKRGTHKQASDYCKKDGDFFEWGDLPADDCGAAGAAAMDALMSEAVECIRRGDYKSIPMAATHFIRHAEYRVRKEMQQDRNLEILDGELEHEWHYGVPRSGKTWKIHHDYPGIYVKDPKERWWDDYMGEDVVLIDDFDVYQKAMAGDIKRWLDRYKFKAPVKGGYLEIRPRKIIITSNYHPNEIWDDDVTRQAITQRVKIVHYPVRWNHPFGVGNVGTTEAEEPEEVMEIS